MTRQITFFLSIILALTSLNAQEQASYWQQQADYVMDIDVDVEKYQYHGKQTIKYTNNSPDVLNKVFYHLYFNAFQPGSEMDVRLQNIVDPDSRMVDNVGTEENPVYESRIAKLTPEEIGFIHVNSLLQDGVAVEYSVQGTVLEVVLAEPIASGGQATLEMDFDAQVPVQVRRSGRENSDEVHLSMTQWYPKLAEYDFQGWQDTPYIAREFQGVWGNYDVTIHMDPAYTIGGTGVLVNNNEIGHGYQDSGFKVKKHKKNKKLAWNFKAEQVHDFAWAADDEYTHDRLTTEKGIVLHFLYKGDEQTRENWKALQPYAEHAMNYFSENIGPYPWPQYSVIQGGDGGMEYAMSTLIAGGANFSSLKGTTYHEMAHAWFQHILATNESLHPWMDEGFTTYISALATNDISENPKENPIAGTYRGYFYVVNALLEEPMTTQADRYDTNVAYSVASYVKGKIFIAQLGYMLGDDVLKEIIKAYYQEWGMKHPTPNDFIRVAEKVSGLELSWYLNEFGQTTHTIDYGIKSVEGQNIVLERIGRVPMPLDLRVTYSDGTFEDYLIPLRMMRGHKDSDANVIDDWAWAYPTYSFEASKPVVKVEIDPSTIMADVFEDNNLWEK